jgi:hypothetical protein
MSLFGDPLFVWRLLQYNPILRPWVSQTIQGSVLYAGYDTLEETLRRGSE